MVAVADSTADDGPRSTPTNIPSAQGAASPCAPCDAGKEVFGGGIYGPPFHYLGERGDDGSLFVDCPRNFSGWVADRRVLDAAPLLLKALRELVEARDRHRYESPERQDGRDGRYGRARAAIAAAEGRD